MRAGAHYSPLTISACIYRSDILYSFVSLDLASYNIGEFDANTNEHARDVLSQLIERQSGQSSIG